MNARHMQMYVVLIATPVMMAMSLALLLFLLPEWRGANLPVHATTESFGGLAAVLLSLFVFQRDDDEFSGDLTLVAIGVLCMGVLSIIHGLTAPGQSFVFLNSFAILAGGFWFALVWLPRGLVHAAARNTTLAWSAAIVVSLLGLGAMAWPHITPPMLAQGKFSSYAIGMNVGAGLLYLTSLPRFVTAYGRTGQPEFFLFFIFALLSGLVGLTFGLSKLWDATWWLWHIMRLVAYLAGLWFLGSQYLRVFEQQKHHREELRQHRDNLEELVDARTAELEQQTQALATSKQTLQTAMQAYAHFTEQVAQGDLTARLTENGNSDLNILNQNLNRMVERLSAMTSQVHAAASNIAAAAAQILAATTEQASTAAQQSAAISQTSTTVEQVKAIAQQTAHQAGQVAQDSQATLQSAQRGTRAVEDTISGMGQIRQRVEGIAQNILQLSEQTQAIGAITTTVSELADQSNMLALNAAIEAARAGEQGKSFAVVAQQVRDLAERSKAATAAVMVTEEGSKGVEQGVRLSTEAGQVIHRISTEVESGAQASAQIASAAHQQTAGMEQITQAIRSIQQATTQSLASTRQAEKAARDLHELAKSLQETVAAYRL